MKAKGVLFFKPQNTTQTGRNVSNLATTQDSSDVPCNDPPLYEILKIFSPEYSLSGSTYAQVVYSLNKSCQLN